MNANQDTIPVLWDTTEAASAFEPAQWFAYCSRRNGRPIPQLPVLAIQTVIPDVFKLACSRYGVEPDDFTLADHPFATFVHDGVPMVIGLSAKGSYAAGGLDEMIALGARKIVFIGGSGVISPEVKVNDVIVATKALRDECVSLHYVPPSRYAYPSAEMTEALLQSAKALGKPVHAGAVWTTMAHFRQAIPRLHKFREEGCIVVNNEASSSFAVGQARGAAVCALLNAGDILYNDHFEVPEEEVQQYQGGNVAIQLDIAVGALIRLNQWDSVSSVRR